VADQEACLDAERLERASLRVGVVDDAAAERPRVRDDDPDLHAARLPAPCEQPPDSGTCQQELRLDRDAHAVTSDPSVEEQLAARAKPRQQVLEIRHGCRGTPHHCGVERPAPCGEQAQREEPGADLEAPVGDVLVRHLVSGDVEQRSDEERERT
jgi:hypothetical protein